MLFGDTKDRKIARKSVISFLKVHKKIIEFSYLSKLSVVSLL
jgi:hypothetical protein